MVDHLRFKHQNIFQKAIPLTTRTIFRKEENPHLDYKAVTESNFDELFRNNEFMFV